MKEKGATTLMVTHDFKQAAEICDRIIIVKNGKIVDDFKLKISNLGYVTKSMSIRWREYHKPVSDSPLTCTKGFIFRIKNKTNYGDEIIFAGLVIVVFSFAFDPANNTTKAVIPGVIWVIIVFAGILGLNRSFISEQRNDTMQGLLVAPMEAASIYLGKFMANFAMMLIVEFVSIPFLFLLFDFKFYWKYSIFYFSCLLRQFWIYCHWNILSCIGCQF